MKKFIVSKRMALTYIFGLILPLLVTDGLVFAILYSAEKRDELHEMENTANAVKYDIEYFFEEGMTVSNNVYLNSSVNDFLNTEYDSAYDYYMASRDILEVASFGKYAGYNVTNIIVYADNDTIVSGGNFYALSRAKGSSWYEKLENSDRNAVVAFRYIGNEEPSAPTKRKIYLVRNLDYFKNGCRKVLRIDLDYNKFARTLSSMNYPYGVYICNGGRILCSNRGNVGGNDDFAMLGDEKASFMSSYTFCGETFDILIMEPGGNLFGRVRGRLPIIFFLIIINFIVPVIMANAINRTVYRDRLERQEMALAKQNAELLALHSQINPHFLFNVLESIRMRCVLQGEDVTAGMIEKLAVLERQTINWASDRVMLSEEMGFISAYLELQKYRFGERLHYEIDIDDDCLEFYLPKLALTVFVENSCVHGIEEKTAACWIYVRAYRKDGCLVIEVEDTGDGMDEEETARLNERMRACTIDDIKENEHVGILNACLRFKMYFDGKVEFTMESEKGAGTFMTVRISEE